MLESVLGSVNRERVLLFIFCRGDGYARQIAGFFATGLAPIQKQLDRLEAGGVLASRKAGRTRLYSFDPRCPFLKELKALLKKVMIFCPDELRERLVMNRRRPRIRQNPL